MPKVEEALREIVHQYELWAEGADDGEFRLWNLPTLCQAIIDGRNALKEQDDACILGDRVSERKQRVNARIVRRLWSEKHGKPWPDGMYACHTCDEPRCSNLRHIFPGTAADNSRDAQLKGHFEGMNAGENHGRHKLSTSDVLEIRDLAKRFSQRSIARQYGVSQAQISRIVRRTRRNVAAGEVV